MEDSVLIETLQVKCGRSLTSLAVILNITNTQTLSNWKKRGIPAYMRPTIWALLEIHCPDVADKLDHDSFLGVHLTGDAA